MASAQWMVGGAELPPVGADIEVRQHYTEGWAPGFVVAGIDLTGDEPEVEVRRRSDGTVLPATFQLRDVRGT